MTPIDCPRCLSNAAFSNEEDKICYGCGFHTRKGWNKTKIKNLEKFEKDMPELYQSVRYIDENGSYWYPQTINLPQKGMVFADGSSPLTWKWCSVPLNSNTGKVDMSLASYYDEKDFIEALDNIGFFSKQ